MAIPAGTTSRQVQALARWALIGVVAIGMLTWWWPGYRAWGAAAAGLLVVWVLWLIWRTVSGDGTVPGNPLHLALLGPAALLTYHLARSGLGMARRGVWPEGVLAGEINISMIFQMALLALAVMLTQSLLSPVAGGKGTPAAMDCGGDPCAHVSICGAAMMLGPAAVMTWGRAEPVPDSLAPLGLAGVAVWLTPLWGPGQPARITVTDILNSPGRLGRVGVAIVMACLLIQASPVRGLFLAAGAAGGVLLLAGLAFGRCRLATLAAGAFVSAGCIVPAALGLLALPDFSRLPFAWIGQGEQAIRQVSPANGGVMILLGMVGPVGLLWTAVCLTGWVCWLLIRTRAPQAEWQWRAVTWTIASALAGCALLIGGGLVIPATTLGAGFTWGLLPAMLGRPSRARPGVIVLACLLAVVLLLGMVRKEGLVAWAAWSFAAGESFLHVTTGFLLALVLAWLLGTGAPGRSTTRWGPLRRKAAFGLAGVAAAILAGGAGELLQAIASPRTAELKDWLMHSAGCAAAIVPYLLSIGARLCESPDVAPTGGVSAEMS
jgi:hypothetical protein